MARQLDETKMERINEAAMQLIVEKGYGNASIAAIARLAGTAEGYLYRFHNSKEEMVNALLFEKIKVLIDNMTTLLESETSTTSLIKTIIEDLFSIAEQDTNSIRFLYVLMHDYNFQISDEQRKQIKDIILAVIKKGQKLGEIGKQITEEEVFYLAIEYPIVFINLRLKSFFGHNKWNKKDQERVIEFCIKGLKE